MKELEVRLVEEKSNAQSNKSSLEEIKDKFKKTEEEKHILIQ